MTLITESESLYYNNKSSSSDGMGGVESSIKEYLSFELIDNSMISFGNTENTIQYSLDKVQWHELAVDERISVTAGKTIYFKASNPSIGEKYGIGTFSSTGRFNVRGNIMSMLYGDNFENQVDLTGKTICFNRLFDSCTTLVDASKMLLPATSLSEYAYYGLFKDCTNLTSAPKLPATTLAEGCYYFMFYGCTSLVNAPALPATTLANSCYGSMFQGCTNLKYTPELPATTLTNYCYYGMFEGCSNLNEIRMLATDISAENCLSKWVEGVSPTGTFYRNPEMTSLPTGVNGIPEGWTVWSTGEDGTSVIGTSNETTYLTLEPLETGTFSFSRDGLEYSTNGDSWVGLPAGEQTVTVNSGDKVYFKNGNATTSSDSGISTFGLKRAASGIGTFESTGSYNVSGNVMSLVYGDDFVGQTDLTENNTTLTMLFANSNGLVDASNMVLPATALTDDCYNGMFLNCTNMTSAPSELPATTLSNSCYANMFSGCESMETSPILPATTLTDYCYDNMYSDCSSLTQVTMLATDVEAEGCLNNWTSNTSSDTVVYIDPSIGSSQALTANTNGNLVAVNENSINYFTIEALGNGALVINQKEIVRPYSILEYKKNNGMWSGKYEDHIKVVKGDKVYLRNTTNNGKCNVTNIFSSSCDFNVSGNVMSLFYSDFKGKVVGCQLQNLFTGCARIIDASRLVLPATKLSAGCYFQMFKDCTRLASAPALPATELTEYCYQEMFSGCTSLKSIPYLPATTLASSCYQSMFSGCTSLKSVHELTATKLANNCYESMFSGCTSLEMMGYLPATTLANGCYNSMFKGCTSLTTPPSFGFETLSLTPPSLGEKSCASMFEGCTNLTSAPKLPFDNLGNWCYSAMFRGCTSLTTAPVLSATTLAKWCYSYMFDGCKNLTSAPAVLHAMTLASYCYYRMFSRCKNLTSAPELPATTLAEYCYSEMFQGCTKLPKAPYLPSQTLVKHCYSYMFEGCSNLNEIRMMATDISAEDCLWTWVEGVAEYGKFYRDCSVTSFTRGIHGIPLKWDDGCDGDGDDDNPGVGGDGDDNNPGVDGDYSRRYLTFEVIEDSTFSFTGNTIQYSMDGNTWYDLTVGASTPTVNAGSKIYFKATNPSISLRYGMGTFSAGTSNVSGNIMSMLYGDGFIGQTDLTGKDYAFGYLFKDCAGLVDASELILPATTLATYCYQYMFKGCTSLTSAPVLPATTLVKSCYSNMFDGCTSLTSAPVLPATTLANRCYDSMFYRCTSLTSAPELPATTLEESCYSHMFQYCTSLTSAPELPATTLTNYCYQSMFSDCTSLTSAPVLPATTLTVRCYYGMFNGCSNLNEIRMYATDISATNCLSEWVYGVASTGTFTKHPEMTSLPTGASGIPKGWTVVSDTPTHGGGSDD